MEEIVLRVRRRDGASRVHLECEWWVAGVLVSAVTPRRIPLANGVSRLTFDQAWELADQTERAVRDLVEHPALFDA